MHLGDFDTERWEIFAVCGECLKEHETESDFTGFKFKWCHASMIGINSLKHVLWKYREDEDSEEKKMVIISLTDHAWDNRHMNHPNTAKTEIIEEEWHP